MGNVFVIIVTYNGMPWLKKCLDSCANYLVIIVDNASTDETVKFIEVNYPDVILIKQCVNLGFGKANNLGISYALKNGADYVFLLNQDAYMEKGSLRKLIEISKVHPEYGILSPFHLNWKGTKLEYYFAKFILKNIEIYSDFVLNEKVKPLYEVPFINAAAWLIPRNIFEIVGGFDPIFHHYGEDNNFSQRLHFHDYKIGVVPNTFIFHDSKIRKEPNEYLFTRSYYLNEVKQLQIKYANVNLNFSEADLRNEIKYIKKLILLKAIKLNLKEVKGYVKKLQLFKNYKNSIIQSRKQNITKGSHYLNF